MSDTLVRQIEQGDAPHRGRGGKRQMFMAALGWPDDALARLAAGDDPTSFGTDSRTDPTAGSALGELLGKPGQLINERLAAIESRLERLEGRAATDTEPSNVAPIARKSASRPAKKAGRPQTGAKQPTQPADNWAYAASRDDGQPATTRPTGRKTHRPSPPDAGPDPTVFTD